MSRVATTSARCVRHDCDGLYGIHSARSSEDTVDVWIECTGCDSMSDPVETVMGASDLDLPYFVHWSREEIKAATATATEGQD